MFSDYNENDRMKMSNEIYVLGVLATTRENFPRIGQENEAISIAKERDFTKEPNIVFFIEPISDDADFARYLNEEYLPEDIVDDIIDLYIGFDNQHFNSHIRPFGQYSSENSFYLTKNARDKKEIVYKFLEDKLILFKANIQYANGGEVEFNKNLKLEAIYDIEDYKYIFKTIPDIKDLGFERKLYSNLSFKLPNYNHELPNPEAIVCNDNFYSIDPNKLEKILGTYDEWIYKGSRESINKREFEIRKEEYDDVVIRKVENLVFIEKEFFYNDLLEDVYKELTEIEFLRDFEKTVLKEELFYEFNDLVNLHTSIKTNALTIISGMSGTGKTQIVLSYANAINECDDKNYLFVPVSPSFIEPKDVLGYFDKDSKSFISAESGLVDFLIKAEENPDKLYFVLFDEMNLSQIEYWFSPFISLLELKKDRELILFNENLKCSNNYKNKITLGDNIRFVGTVNIDETTKDFSDRVLDRANLVNLQRLSLKKYRENLKNVDYSNLESSNSYTFKNYNNWIKESNNTLSEVQLEFLDELHVVLNEYNSQKGVSFRTALNIEKYIENIPLNEENENIIPKSEAFDIQIKQRLLTKIKGSSLELSDILQKIDKLFNKYHLVSDFIHCKEEITKKMKELNLYGYAN